MSTVRLSEGEARRAGLLAPRSKPSRKQVGRAGARSWCVTHNETFTTDTAETAHVEQGGGWHSGGLCADCLADQALLPLTRIAAGPVVVREWNEPQETPAEQS